MGAIWVKRNSLIGSTSEIIGYKSGLGLTKEELNDIIPNNLQRIWFGEDNQLLRIRSEEFEDLISHLLYKVGNIGTPSIISPTITLFKKYKEDPEKLEIYHELMKKFLDFMKIETRNDNQNKNKTIDPTPYVDKAKEKYGLDGLVISIEIIEGFNLQLHKSPWGIFRQVEWIDVAQLKELFESESLETLYGKFIDQRYIDFLSQNFDSLDKIHWRKFEALTCEFFEKAGYYVEIGEGRDDDGIDARVWTECEVSGPPTILVQCKRYKSKIEKMVVKSLWADMLEYEAKSGLIVTTSSLSPGAEKVCTARGYSIGQANRNSLKEWLRVMRTPYKGAFLSE